jgi:hypothetical protein
MIFIPLHSFIHSFILGFVGIFSESTFCLFVCLFVQIRGEGGALHVVVGHGDNWVCFVLFGRQRHHSSPFGQKLTMSVLDVYLTDFDGLFLWAMCGVGEDQSYTKQKRERESSDGLDCGCRVQTDQFPVHHQFSKPNILHNFHHFLTPDHLQLLQNHHNVFLILQLILNDLMLQLVMGMGLWNRTTMVVGKTLKHNPE